jgi:diacylglycerol O-acyltransferase / wax synthase
MRPERLSATDQAFLVMDDRGLPMNVGVLLVMNGRLELGEVRQRIHQTLGSVPRLRQKITQVPGLGRAWVDDPGFDLAQHVVSMRAPRPGRHDELTEVAARLFAAPLDRTRPVWKLWAISGLEGDRSAIALVAHHAMVDGVGGVGVLAAMFTGASLSHTAVSAPRSPSRRALAWTLFADRARAISGALRSVRPGSARRALEGDHHGALGVTHALQAALTPAPRTALNPTRVSHARGFAGVRVELDRAKEIKRALGGTINDVVLATVAGAVRRHLDRGGDADAIRRFRAAIPVDLRARTGDPHPMGNSVAFMLATLPIDEPSPHARYAAIRATTEHLKRDSYEIQASAWLEQLADALAPGLVSAVFRIAARVRAFHLVVTNVPGPVTPLSFGPARIDEVYGLVPLFAQQALGVAVLSYAGGLFFGLHTDARVVPDPRELARDIEASFEELARLVPRETASAEAEAGNGATRLPLAS